MDILYSSSDSYAFLTGISMLSLLENNKSCAVINLYIMDNAISDANKAKLRQIAQRYDRPLQFVPMPDLEGMIGQKIDTRRWNISTFGRLYMAGVLPETVHKVVNIDCDTIVEDSLEPLWAIDLTDKVVGGMLECINDRYRRNIGMHRGESYLNGGIIYLNLDKVRAEGYEQRFTEYINTYGSSLAYLDQDVINGVVKEEGKLKLPMRYNVMSLYYYASYAQILKIRRSESFYTEEEFQAAIVNPAIVHFTTCFLDGLRPWIRGNIHPHLQKFLYYKEKSPWKDMPLQEDGRGRLSRFKTTIIRKAPKFLLCEAASIMHGVLVPEQNLKRMQAAEKKHARAVQP